MSIEQKSPLNIVMVSPTVLQETNLSDLTSIQGAMTFGEAGKQGARVHDLKDVEAILDVFQAHGHYEVSWMATLILFKLKAIIRSIPL